MAQVNRIRPQVTLTLDPSTVQVLADLADRWGIDKGKLIDLAVEHLARSIGRRPKLDLAERMQVLAGSSRRKPGARSRVSFTREGEGKDTPTHPKSGDTRFSGQGELRADGHGGDTPTPPETGAM